MIQYFSLKWENIQSEREGTGIKKEQKRHRTSTVLGSKYKRKKSITGS
jgi:hypothetical protein